MRKTLAILKLRWQGRARLRRAGAGGGAASAGMTLLEIMIVLALIGLVMGGLVRGVEQPASRRARSRRPRWRWGRSAQAAQQYMMENSSNCPASIDDLVSNKNMTKKSKDPWGTDYTLKCPGTGDPDGVDVISTGPDRQEGTADDIKSWDE